MKKTILIFVISLLISQIALAQRHYAGLKLGLLNHRWAEVGVGYGITPAPKSAPPQGGYIPNLIFSPTFGMEFNYGIRGEDRKIYAPKFSVELHNYIVGTRLNLINYRAQGQQDWRFRPEAGFSLVGIVYVFYGYNIPLSETRFAEVQPHKISVCINLPLKEF
jgi:hypothetical protein